MGVIPMGEHYKSIFLSVIILADKFPFIGEFLMLLDTITIYQPYVVTKPFHIIIEEVR